MLVQLCTAALLASASGGAFAGPTHANASSAYWNTAALVRLPTPHAAMLEVSGMLFDVSYQRAAEDPTRESAYPEVGFRTMAPDLSATLALALPWRSLRFVLGAFSPTGGGTRWPEDGPQRYHATDGTALTYGVVAGLLWSPSPRFGLAAGAGPLYALVELTSAYDFAAFVNALLPPGAGLFELEDPAMEGELALSAEGWTSVVTLGAYAEPVDDLRLAASFIAPQTARLGGEVNVRAPPALAGALPDHLVSPRGTFALSYPIPWVASAEAEVGLGRWSFAGLFQYVRRSAQRILRGQIVESEAGFIEGERLSVKELRDKWAAGLRATMVLDERWAIAARVDLSPRNIPKEAISPVNLDFTQLEANLGARLALAEGLGLEVTYGAARVVPIEVDRSIFNPRADPASGLALPSARGRYDAWAQKLVVALAATWGEAP